MSYRFGTKYFELIGFSCIVMDMEKEDARRHSRDQLHARRKQVLRLHQQGQGIMNIVNLTGLSYPTVRKAIRLYEAGGASALQPKSAGRMLGTRCSLSAEQERAIQKAICDKRPEQLKLDFYLWSRKAVMQLIEQDTGIQLTVRAVGNYLARWGSTPQKPIKKAYEQRPESAYRIELVLMTSFNRFKFM
jgi:transposase